MARFTDAMKLLAALRELGRLATNPPDPSDAEAARDWVIEGCGPAGVLAQQTSTALDDAAIAIIRDVVASDAFTAVYGLFYGLFKGDQSDSLGAADDDPEDLLTRGRWDMTQRQRQGLRIFRRRLGGREERVGEALRNIIAIEGKAAVELMPRDVLADLVLDRMYGSERVSAWDDIDWAAIREFIEWIIATILPMIMMFI